MIIPYKELSEDVLYNLAKDFVLREGTDYGDREFSVEDKISKVIKQIKSNKAHIVFDSEDESFNIVAK